MLQEVFESVEEMERRNVEKPKKALKGNKEDLKKKAPQKLKTKRRRISRTRQLRRFFALLFIFFFASGVAVFLLHEHYVTYTGEVKRESIQLRGRGSDYIAIRWDGARNTDKYEVYCKEYVREEGHDESEETDEGPVNDSWEKLTTTGTEVVFKGLKEASYYSFVIRPVNEHMMGRYTKIRHFSTKRTQKLKVDKKITKLTVNEPFEINAKAKTKVVYTSSDKEVADIDPKTGKIVPKAAGYTEITVKAQENNQFTAASEVVELEVIDTYSTPAGGASAHNIYHLSPDNCEVVKTITGANGADIPQSFGYTGDKYIVAFGMGNPNRIISFDVDGDGKEVSVPQLSLGHPNGFAYADENKTCYCVKGWSSRAVTYKPETGEYDAVNLPYGCSGIAYDRKEKLLYTSSRTVMATYNISDGYSVVNSCGVVRHSGSLATQDIGAHGGIMIRCLSPNGNVHGTNYLDLYDMRNGTYLGTISCDLSEVESAIVNDDGFLELLANNSGEPDYIWRTEINIESIAEGLPE